MTRIYYTACDSFNTCLTEITEKTPNTMGFCMAINDVFSGSTFLFRIHSWYKLWYNQVLNEQTNQFSISLHRKLINIGSQNFENIKFEMCPFIQETCQHNFKPF